MLGRPAAMSVQFTSRVLHAARARLARLTLRKPPPPSDPGSRRSQRRAAVLIPLVHVHGEASLLFTLRSSNVGSHKGQVSFPGGHIDDGETPVDAALREAVEELGSPMAKVDVLGLFQPYRAITGTHVSTVVGYVPGDLGDLRSLTPNADEVDAVFTLPLTHLRDRKNIEYQELTSPVHGTSTVPRYLGGPAPVWGLTAVMLSNVLHDVLWPAVLDGAAFGEAAGDERPQHVAKL